MKINLTCSIIIFIDSVGLLIITIYIYIIYYNNIYIIMYAIYSVVLISMNRMSH